MTVANDTAPARIVLQIAVRRDEGRDLHLNGLRQETPVPSATPRRATGEVSAYGNDSVSPGYAAFNSSRHQLSLLAVIGPALVDDAGSVLEQHGAENGGAIIPH